MRKPIESLFNRPSFASKPLLSDKGTIVISDSDDDDLDFPPLHKVLGFPKWGKGKGDGGSAITPEFSKGDEQLSFRVKVEEEEEEEYQGKGKMRVRDPLFPAPAPSPVPAPAPTPTSVPTDEPPAPTTAHKRTISAAVARDEREEGAVKGKKGLKRGGSVATRPVTRSAAATAEASEKGAQEAPSFYRRPTRKVQGMAKKDFK